MIDLSKECIMEHRIINYNNAIVTSLQPYAILRLKGRFIERLIEFSHKWIDRYTF